MAHRKTSKRSKAKTILRLADLEQSKNAVLHSLGAASSQESYGHAIDEFIGWYCSLRGRSLQRCSPKGAALGGAPTIGAFATRDRMDPAHGPNLACFSRKLLAECNSGRSDSAFLHIVRS